MRAEPPLANAFTCSTVAIVVSPGNVVSNAPCAQPRLTDCLWRFAGEQSVEETRRKAVAAAHAVKHVEFADWRLEGLAFNPRDRAPTVAIGRVDFAQRGGHRLDLGIILYHRVNHPEEHAWVELALGGHIRPFQAEALLQVFLVADQHIHVLDYALHHRQRLFIAAPDVPEFLAEVQVEGRHRPGSLGGFHGFNDQFARGLGERGEDAAAVEPADTRAEDLLPVEVAGFEHGPRLVAAVVKHHRSAHPMALVAINRGMVRTTHAIVLEFLVERLHAHCPDALGDEVADGIFDQRGGDTGVQAEAIRQVGGTVELAAADMDVAVGGLAERDDARIEAVDERAERQEIQRAFFRNVQTFAHGVVLMIIMLGPPDLPDRIPERPGGARRFFLIFCKTVSFFCKMQAGIQKAGGNLFTIHASMVRFQ